jgi:hypothetical protein
LFNKAFQPISSRPFFAVFPMPSLFEYQEKRPDSITTKIFVLNKIANIEIQETQDRAQAKILFVGGAEKDVALPREVLYRFLKEFRAYQEKH